MASPAAGARPGARGRALVLALVACALALVAIVAVLSRGGTPSRAPTAAPDIATPPSSEARAQPAATRDVDSVGNDRSAIAADVSRALEGPRLRGLLLDEDGAPIDGRTARVELRGPLDQRLVLAVDAQGRFGPQRMVAGTWQVSASAPGRIGASREVGVREDVALEPLRLVLPRERVLEVSVRAVGRGSEGDPDDDLAAIERQLSLRLVVAGEPRAQRTGLTLRTSPSAPDRQWRARFEPPSGPELTLELLQGAELVLRRPIGADEREVVLSVDPVALGARLVELEVDLFGPDGRPLGNVGQVLLVWDGLMHLSAGQPGPEPARARFEACPPGPATLRVVDVDGRRGEVDLFVPYEGPARLEVALELVEPARD